jgi:SAM-dependent methyltransferase
MSEMQNQRLDFPSAGRNANVIAKVLATELSSEPCAVLEIASGSGQHGVHFCKAMPNLSWWPTDLDAAHLNSINAWRTHADLTDRIHTATALDVCAENWRLGQNQKGWPQTFDAMVNINMIHISPWAATLGLMEGAAQVLRPGGVLVLYGPFKKNGQHTAPSNVDFDESLKSRNPTWGVRDRDEVAAIARAQGLTLRTEIAMPANNFSLVFACS